MGETPGPVYPQIPLTILLPVHNEREGIRAVLEEHIREIGTRTAAQVIVAEDGSTDGTDVLLRELEKELPIKVVSSRERKGYQRASRDALALPTTDLIFYVDSDGQHRARDFWRLYEGIQDADLVWGRKVKRADPWHRVFISFCFNLLARLLFGIDMFDIDTGFRLIRREVRDKILDRVHCLRYGFTAEFVIRAHHAGFRVKEVPVVHLVRQHGISRVFPLHRLPFIVLWQVWSLLKLRWELLKTPRGWARKEKPHE